MTVAANQRYHSQIQVIAEAFIEAFTEAFTEAFMEVTTDIAADITADITVEVLAEAAGGLGHRLQIQLIVLVVQAQQGLEETS